MYCKKCGAKIPENVKFCTSCGNPVVAKADIKAQLDDGKAFEKDNSISNKQGTEQSTQKKAFTRKRPYAFIAVVLAFLIVGAIGFAYYYSEIGSGKVAESLSERTDATLDDTAVGETDSAEEPTDYPVVSEADDTVSEIDGTSESVEETVTAATESDSSMDTELSDEAQNEIQNQLNSELPPEEAPIYSVTVSAPDGYVNFRTGPGTDYDIIMPINNGIELNVFEESNNQRWLRIFYDSRSGWIAASQVSKN